MSKIKIEMFPAKGGDAFLLEFDNGKNILIDMGYASTYTSHIKEKLIKLNSQGKCIDLLVITHIDEDHIGGAIKFLSENGCASSPKIIKVNEIWHNSYRHLQFEKKKVDSISDIEKRQLESLKYSNLGDDDEKETKREEISADQGSTLAGYIYGLGYEKNWNTSFEGKDINVDNNREVILDDIQIKMLSPDTKKLSELSKKWNDKLEEMRFDFNISDEEIFDDAFEMYIKKLKPIIASKDIEISDSIEEFESTIEKDIPKCVDDSVSNGSSIAFLLKYKEKRILFLGDSHEDIVIQNLKAMGEEKEVFDVIKLSHHGSIRNNYENISSLNAKNYLISTDGKKHNHPSKESIALLLKKSDCNKNIYFNYPLKIYEILNNEELKKKYKYSINIGDGERSTIIEVD